MPENPVQNVAAAVVAPAFKPWDVTNLWDRLKNRGLDQLEAVAKIAGEEIIAWSSESLAASEKSVLKFFAPVVLGLKPVLLEQIDKINKKVG